MPQKEGVSMNPGARIIVKKFDKRQQALKRPRKRSVPFGRLPDVSRNKFGSSPLKKRTVKTEAPRWEICS